MSKFEDAIDVVLANEGGYSNDPKDPGGETRYGISKKSYPNVDIKNLTVEGAKVIYLRDFWKFGGINSQPVATKLFDSYVNMKHAAVRLIQGLVGATQDGAYGPATEHLINLEDPAVLLSRYRIELAQHYIDIVSAHPEEHRFLDGWLKRARQ